MNPRTLISANSIVLLALSCLLVCTPRAFSDDDKIQKIAVMGASASAGFGVVEEIMISEDSTQRQVISLGDVLIKTVRGEGVVVLDLASGGFFSKPVRFAKASVKRANEWNADLVFGIDFLFWFLYGSGDLEGNKITEEKARLAKLEEGLRILDDLKAPLIIGDVPDMSPAVGKMLTSSQMPDLQTLDTANQRIWDWASERPDVSVAPLFELINSLRSEEPFVIGEYRWNPKVQGVELILPDRLHPSLHGIVALTQALAVATSGIDDLPERMPPLVLEHEAIVERVRRGDVPPAQPVEEQTPEESSSASP